MENRELWHILGAIVILTAVIAFLPPFEFTPLFLLQSLVFSALIICVAVFSKKIMASMLDADVEHNVWMFKRYGFYEGWHLKKEAPAGIIFPLLLTVYSLGYFRFMAILTYEPRALKARAAKRFGPDSYTMLTDFHNGLIGAAGIIGVLILSAALYFVPANLEYFAKMATFYAFFNMLPISKLDGTQIFFGSRILYTVIGIITLIFTAFALVVLV